MIKKIIFLIIFLVCISAASAWDVIITATNQLEPIVFGVDEDATTDYDAKFDIPFQTPMQDKVVMGLDNVYAKSYIGENDELTWNIAVGVPVEQSTELTWTLNNVPADLHLFIVYNSDKINIKNQNTLHLGEGSHKMIVEAENTNTVEKKTSSSGSRDTSSFLTPNPEPNNIVEDKEEKTEKVLKPEDTPSKIDTVREEKQTEQTETHEESKKSTFIGISIIISIIAIGLLIYFITTKITGGVKSE